MAFTRRKAITMLAGGAVAATAGCIGGSQQHPPEDASIESGPITQASVPQSAEGFEYPVLGNTDGPIVDYFMNWKCPVCRQFTMGLFPKLVSEYEGDITFRLRSLVYFGDEAFLGPDAPDAGRAAHAVWREDPERFWRYYKMVMKYQPPESEQWATADTLVRFAEAAGIENTEPVRRAVTNDEYQQLLRRTANYASEIGVDGPPTLGIAGETFIGSEENGEEIRNAIDSLAKE